MRTTLLTTIVLAILGALALSAPAQAADTLSCDFETDLSYSNGGTDFTSESGTVNCVGEANGGLTAGVGRLQLTGSSGEAPPPAGGERCLLGAGFGTIELSIPDLFAIFDPDPYTTLTGAFQYQHAAPVWEAHGSVSDGGTRSTGVAIAGIEDASCGASGKTASTLSGQLIVGGEVAGDDSPASGPCANHISGSSKSDRLTGTSADDMLSGFGGADRISAKSGADCIFGGSGTDVLRGGRGRDVLHCGAGADVVHADHADKIAPNCEKVRSH